MGFKRNMRKLLVHPNSTEGLIIRAQDMEDEALKIENANVKENFILYAKMLRELSKKNLTNDENAKFIAKVRHEEEL